MTRAMVVVLTLFLLCLTLVLDAQTKASDPQSLQLAAQSQVALTGGGTITDVTLIGNVTFKTGSESGSGTATLKALGRDESRIDLVSSYGNHTYTEIRDASTDGPVGQWIGPDEKKHPMATHNCRTDAVWFFPAFSALTSAATDQQIALSYVGRETWQGIYVQHVRATTIPVRQSVRAAKAIQKLNTIDYYLDASSFLPILIQFSAHPDHDFNISIPVQIVFSDYRSMSGAKIPYHIRKFFDGRLQLDFQATAVTMNSGLQLSEFTAQ